MLLTWKRHINQLRSTNVTIMPSQTISETPEYLTQTQVETNVQPKVQEEQVQPQITESPSTEPTSTEPPATTPNLRRSARTSKPPDRYGW